MPRLVELYDNSLIYPEWPQRPVGVAFVPVRAARELGEPEGAWSPGAGQLDVPIRTTEGDVPGRATQEHTQLPRRMQLHHRPPPSSFLGHMCDLPERHQAHCECLHVPPGWTALRVRGPPDRILYISLGVLRCDTSRGIHDPQRDPPFHVWLTARCFVVDHLRAEDVAIYINGPDDVDPLAVARWWLTWQIPA